jgi:hypothetical protein
VQQDCRQQRIQQASEAIQKAKRLEIMEDFLKSGNSFENR